MVYYNKKKRRRFVTWFTLIVISGLVSIPLFYNLGLQPVRLWDEARRAFNALEMMDGGSWLVTHFQGEPDMWGTKPPLFVWLQALSMSAFGVNAFALRLPSALAGLFTAIAMLYFANRFTNNRWYGAMAAIILVTSAGYLSRHVVRTGDFDSLLTLFMFLYAMYFYKVLHVDRAAKRAKTLWLMMLFFTLAVLTKGIAGMLFVPGLAIYLFTTQAYKKILYNKQFYFAALLSVAIVAGFYLWREQLNPGYLKAVWHNEIGGRYTQSLEGHAKPWYFFLQGLVQERFSYWWIYIIPAFIGAWYFRERKLLRFLLFGSILVVSFLTIISLSQTKLMWYDAPLYPFLAIFSAIGIMYILYLLQYIPQFLFKVGYRSYVTGMIFSAIALFFLLKFPVADTLKRINQKDMEPWHEEWYAFGHFMHNEAYPPNELQGFCLLEEGYQPQNGFYLEQLKREHEVVLPRCEWDDLQESSKVIVIQSDVKLRLKRQYQVKLLDSYPPLEMYQIIGER
ncbi:MAG: ArnT family glycosyltransferase [Bacteroidota bacterium]